MKFAIRKMGKGTKDEYRTPQLMKDSSEVDGHAEAVMDYILSWCLRWSETKYEDIRPILNHYCRYMLLKLVEKSSCDDVIVGHVDVWKQSQKIDLWVEARLVVDGKEERHAILIENKYYSPLHLSRDCDGEYRSQLEVYKKKFEAYYAEKANCHLHFAVITCMERSDGMFEATYDEKEIEQLGFKLYSFDDMLDETMSIDSESDIFNEFWLRSW